MAKSKPKLQGPNPPKGKPRGAPTREPHTPGMYTRPVPANKRPSYDKGLWRTAGGAVFATGKTEDAPRKPVYSNRNKTPPKR